ncbi:hypothetical protein LZF95_09765 [Algoriphagus sp. AGSA1]|uniref:hypothetical protein n=1 Tax=Algoriphagus sp. AGSA1 TaxID=2907213 RepID=UPI001F45ADC8|nr:hypothetical protein [Algoriphagus sp. AGSA1]MCE7054959.1 hypothetical protein [Algoriphagus sp. AGSA1]
MNSAEQFPTSKVGKFLVWFLLFLAPLLLVGEEKGSLSKPEAKYMANVAQGIAGPTDLCLTLGSATGDYSIIDPSSGEYTWLLQNPDGSTSTITKGGAASVGTIQIRYTVPGSYTLTLEERTSPSASPNSTSISITVARGPGIILKPDYLLCVENIPTLQAMDPADPDLGKYEFTWARDEEFVNVVYQDSGASGNVFTPTEEGYYYVQLKQADASSSCEVTAATYVGPPVDFEFVQNKEEVCQGESVKIELDTPINGEWWYRKQGDSDKISLGSSYAVTLGNTQFTEPGTYDIGFIASDPNSSCPSERITTVRQKEGPKINFNTINTPSSCGVSDGSFEMIIVNDMESVSLLDEDLNVTLDYGPQQAGAVLPPVTGLEAGIYTIAATNTEGCAGYLFHPLNLSEAPDETDIVTFKEECVLDGFNMGRVEITFPNGNVTGEYRILSANTGISTYGSLSDGNFISEDLPGGIYFFDFEYEEDACHPLIKTFRIERRRDVPFSLPEVIEICDSYELSLQASLDLNFELTQPDGTMVTANTGESFLLEEEGDYSLYIAPVDADGDYCPIIQEFRVEKLDDQIDFSYEVIDENCQGDQIWGVVMQNLDVEDAIFRWYNSVGEIVGRTREYRPTEFGEVYQLTVQPKAMAACQITPLEIPFDQPILSVSAVLSYEEECDFFSVNLEVPENTDQVTWIEWTLFLEDGSAVDLDAGAELYDISDERTGIYEAIIYRDKQSGGRCEIARVNISIEERTLTPKPELEDSYPFCSKGNGIPAIDPGPYESYSWTYLTGDVVVGTDSTFFPKQAGLYKLAVLTVEGCIYEEEFRVYDVCDIDYVLPNAMILGDAERDFRVTVSEGVSEAEMYVINSTGELIHYATENEIGFQEPILHWDGKVRGEYAPLGTYAIILILRNPEYGLDEKITKSLLILE